MESVFTNMHLAGVSLMIPERLQMIACKAINISQCYIIRGGYFAGGILRMATGFDIIQVSTLKPGVPFRDWLVSFSGHIIHDSTSLFGSSNTSLHPIPPTISRLSYQITLSKKPWHV